MLAERLTDWTLHWKKEALRLLIKLTCLKYGELPDWALQKMEQADIQQLEIWAERILPLKA